MNSLTTYTEHKDSSIDIQADLNQALINETMLKGKVIGNLTANRYQVNIENDSCKSCSSFGHKCSTGGCLMTVVSEVLLNPGDAVLVENNPSKNILGAGLLFLFPLVSLFLVYFLTDIVFNNQIAASVTSVISLLPSYFLVYILSKKYFNKLPGAYKSDE